MINKTFSFSKTITADDINMFAEVTGDFNPLHMDPEYCKHTRFKERIAHGFLTGSLISTAISKEFPGAIYLKQDMKFLKPVKIGDTITSKVEIISVDQTRKFIKLATSCINQKGEEVIQGDALILLSK